MNEMKRKRIVKKNKRIKKRESMEVDITSLLDILVILLVFLLQSYNASNLQLDLVENITPPGSSTRELGDDAIIIQVNKNKELWVDYEKLSERVIDGQTSQALLSKLEAHKEDSKRNRPDGEPSKKINLVFDKNLPYSTMQTIMQTAAKAGHSEFKFIVMADHIAQGH